MGVVSWALWGLFVGVIARLLLPGRHRIGFLLTMLLGIGGSLLGGVIATRWLNIGDSDNFDFGSFLIAVLTSVLLLGLVERIDRILPDRRRGDRERTSRRVPH
jgi:uncharacterized membrane protein YeaQ/YmgE (transglycosylase-associated protein family)